MDQDIEPADEALVLAVARREEHALALLLSRHGGWAGRFAERLTGDPQTAEEVVQTAFLRLWSRADRWEGRSRFTTWFYRVLHNLCIDEIRRRRVGFELLGNYLRGDKDYEITYHFISNGGLFLPITVTTPSLTDASQLRAFHP